MQHWISKLLYNNNQYEAICICHANKHRIEISLKYQCEWEQMPTEEKKTHSSVLREIIIRRRNEQPVSGLTLHQPNYISPLLDYIHYHIQYVYTVCFFFLSFAVCFLACHIRHTCESHHRIHRSTIGWKSCRLGRSVTMCSSLIHAIRKHCSWSLYRQGQDQFLLIPPTQWIDRNMPSRIIIRLSFSNRIKIVIKLIRMNMDFFFW